MSECCWELNCCCNVDTKDLFDELKARERTPKADLKKQAELFTGSDGSVLLALSAKDGKKISQMKLDVLPVFDGMIAAGGRIYMSTVDGKVVCLGSK